MGLLHVLVLLFVLVLVLVLVFVLVLVQLYTQLMTIILREADENFHLVPRLCVLFLIEICLKGMIYWNKLYDLEQTL